MSNDSNSKWKKNIVPIYDSVIVHNTSLNHIIYIWLKLSVNNPIHIEGMVYVLTYFNMLNIIINNSIINA